MDDASLMPEEHTMKLGIDVGRVLISPGDESRPDTSFIGGSHENALRTPPYPGMFDTLPGIVARFAPHVWIVSKCGARVQQRTRDWFEHHRFFARTGIDPANVRFCLERPQKALHCAELGITHFVDDRVDVLQAMRGVVRERILFGPQRRSPDAREGLRHVAGWSELGELLR
jgi:hypothetical protein